MRAQAELLGESPGITKVREQVDHLLAHEGRSSRLPPILLQGETGTGKGLLAHLIHRRGGRRAAPFVDVNCAAIPEPLLEAELFGVERGAFTDARHSRPGLFQAAHRGTLFLDEIGLLPLALQAKLLKVLEERSVRRLGSTRFEAADVRIVAASNEDLAAAIRARRFREDLYHRLAVVTLTLPPLRERGEDVLLLARHFLAHCCADYRLPPKQFTPDALGVLRARTWPGNVRELSNVIERAALLADRPTIGADLVRGPEGSPAATPSATGVAAALGSFDRDVSALERQHIVEALETTRWNVSRAACRLGISRDRLRYRIRRLGLGRGPRREPPSRPSPAPAPTPISGRAQVEMLPGAALRWEERWVALLRADLVQPANAEGGQDHSRLLTALMEKITSFGGRLQEVSRATVIAAFGLEPTDDAATAAAVAAEAIQHAATSARQTDPRAPAVRLGIHVGQMMVGHVAGAPQIDLESKHAAWTALASVASTTGEDAILVTHAAAPFLERRFELRRAGNTEGRLDGFYHLMRRERTGFGLGGRPLTPFVGREREMQLLTELLGRAERGHGHVVALVGERGVGKSRLVYEVMQARRPQDWRALSCGGAPYGGTTAWLPIADLCRRYFQLDESDSRARITEKISTAMRAFSDPADASPILALLDVPPEDAQWAALDPPQRRERMLDAMTRVLLRESEARPLLMIVEDLHWTDGETQTLLDRLVESLPSAQMLLLVTYRPEFSHSWGNKTFYAQLPVGPLPPEHAGMLLGALLGTNAGLDGLRKILIERAEGNPFFIEESVWALVESGALVGEPGAWRLARSVESAEVPATVQAILGARLDRLPDGANRALEAASVIGREGPLGLLERVSGLPADALRLWLGHLRAAELLYTTSPPRDPGFVFKHALTRDVAYERVPQDRRCELHGATMRAIEQLYSDRLAEQVERLAHHAVQGEMWERATGYCRQAGIKAMERSANREAARWFGQAIEALAHVSATGQITELAIDVRFDLKNALFPLGELERGLATIREAEQLAESLGDRRRLSRALGHEAHLCHVRGPLDRGVEAGRRGLQLAEEEGDPELQVLANYYLATVLCQRGHYRQAVALLERAVEVLERGSALARIGMTGIPAVTTRAALAFYCALLGRFPEGIRYGKESIEIADAARHPYSQVYGDLLLGLLYTVKGDLDRALQRFERGLSICRANGLQLTGAQLLCFLGWAHAQGGRLVQALAAYEEGFAVMASAQTVGVACVMAEFAETLLLAGRVDDALEQASRALDLARANNEGGSQVYALRTLAEIYSQREPLDAAAAMDWYRQAMILAEELGMRPTVAHCHLGLGRLASRTSSPHAAREHLATAAAMYHEMDMRFWLAKAEAELERNPR
jgi:DNA-binding NtrC family response regulator/tetratricopeptide (TPR) repeat protein